MHINVNIVEILKYDLSYMRYYIVIATRELIIILDLIILYNFDIKFDFIGDHMKKL